MKVDYNNMSKIREEDDNNNGRGKLIKVSQTTEKEDKITPSPKSILNLQLQASASPLVFFFP
jgi:subtilase family serine protease